MLRKLESLKQDLGDGVSALAQRTVHAAQEYLLNPFAIQVKNNLRPKSENSLGPLFFKV